ncbi:MAG: hypothetical protein ABJA10_07620 [Aestuariivirga sp.]
MVSAVIYNTFVQAFANKEIDFFGATDTWRVVIHTDAPVPTTDAALADLTEIGNSNGYTSGGGDITFNSTRTTNVVTVTSVDFVWTASAGNLGGSTTGRYFSIYDDTHVTNQLFTSYDYGATFTVASTETMTVDFGASTATLTG